MSSTFFYKLMFALTSIAKVMASTSHCWDAIDPPPEELERQLKRVKRRSSNQEYRHSSQDFRRAAIQPICHLLLPKRAQLANPLDRSNCYSAEVSLEAKIGGHPKYPERHYSRDLCRKTSDCFFVENGSIHRGTCEAITKSETILQKTNRCRMRNGILEYIYEPVTVTINEAFVCSAVREYQTTTQLLAGERQDYFTYSN